MIQHRSITGLIVVVAFAGFSESAHAQQMRPGGQPGGFGMQGGAGMQGFGTGGGLGTGFGLSGGGGLGMAGGGLGTGFGLSGGGGLGGQLGGSPFGTQLGQGTGFRPSSSSVGLLGAGGRSFDPFAATRANPLSFGAAGGGQISGVGGQIGGYGGLTGLGGMAGYGGNIGGFGGVAGLQGGFGIAGGIAGGMMGYGGNRMGMTGSMSGMGYGSMSGTTGRTASVAYSLRAGFTPPPLPKTEVATRLEKVFTTSFTAGGHKVNIEFDGSVAVLKGKVPTEHDKQLVEAMARLEPGVYEIRNELQISPEEALPPPRRVDKP